jgi:adenosylmethionine-8-amino-7-oxononanoate aminotransferase
MAVGERTGEHQRLGLEGRELGRWRVHHALAKFPTLEELYPGVYPREIVRGEGIYLYDAAGRPLIDCSQHLGACAIGHGRREIAESMEAQASTLELCPLDGGFTSAPMLKLAAKLREIAPIEDAACYFTSTGSEASEQAIKLARWCQALRGEPRRVKIVARAGSYHGAGFGGTTLTGNPRVREPFAPLLPGVLRLTKPEPGQCGYCEAGETCTAQCAMELERLLKNEGPETVAALIAEPIAAYEGVNIPGPDYWATISSICRKYGVLLILDEVVTGFGRTGRMFGSEHWDLSPDIMFVAKGITSGYVPLASTIVSGRIHEMMLAQPLAHTNTYAGHAVACTAALTNIAIIEREGLVHRARDLGAVLRESLESLVADLPRLANPSAIGLIGSFEIPDGRPEVLLRLRHECAESGVLIRGNTDGERTRIILQPPLIATEAEIGAIFDGIRDAFPRTGL